MAWKLEKLFDDDNASAVFRLTIPQDKFTVTFTRQTFREVFDDALGFSPQRTGHVLKLLNKFYPLLRSPIRLEDRYSAMELKEYLESLGFSVAKKISNRIDPYTAINLLENSGYQVHGFMGNHYYYSPELNFSRN